MNWSDTLSILTAGAYTLATLAMLAGFPLQRKPLQRVALGLCVAGFILHTALLLASIFGAKGAVEPGFFVRLFAWMLLLVFFLAWHILRNGFLGLVVAPVALIAYLSSFTIPADAFSPATLEVIRGVFGPVHIGSLFCSVALATIACIAALFFLYMDTKLKHKARLTELDRAMPALSVSDRINYLAALAGFPLYTIGMFSGFFNAGRVWGATLSWDPKEILSLIIWGIYGVWFYQRLMRGARGRKMAVLAIVVFLACAFSMFGLNLLFDTHHSFRA